MANFEITKEMLENARTYMPLAIKEGISLKIAQDCVKEEKSANKTDVGRLFLPLPSMMFEDAALKAMLTMNAFFTFYFDLDMPFEDENGKEIDVYEQYDYFNDGNVINQIERFKSDIALRDKAFDLLADFKEFKKFVDVAVYNRKTKENDGLLRLVAALSAAIFSDPKVFEELKKRLEEVKTEKVDAHDD